MHTKISPLVNTSPLIYLFSLKYGEVGCFAQFFCSCSFRFVSLIYTGDRANKITWRRVRKRALTKNRIQPKQKQKKIVCAGLFFSFVSGSSKNYKNFPINLIISIKWGEKKNACDRVQTAWSMSSISKVAKGMSHKNCQSFKL